MKISVFVFYIIGIVAMLQILAFVKPVHINIYYSIMFIGLLSFIFHRVEKINFYILIFIIISLISIFYNEIPAIFRSDLRLLSFILVSSLVGPLFTSIEIHFVRVRMFMLINKLLIFFSALSFFVYLFKINFNYSNTSYSSGLFNHSLILGPLTSVSLLIVLNLLLNKNIKLLNTKFKFSLYIIAFLLFLSLLISSSRSSIIGFSIGFLFLIFYINKGNFTNFMKTIFIPFFLILITFPFWSLYTKGVQEKFNKEDLTSTTTTQLLNSRKNHWDARMYEFKSSPIFGVGFASADINSPIGVGFNLDTGGLEPGSSWLAILAMTGIIGIIPFIIYFIKIFVFFLKNRESDNQYGLLFSIFVFFILHMFSEGYFLASGSFLFFYVWLLLGIIQGAINSYKVSVI